jgi:BMFP domain-containing protein YqiC
MNGAISQLKIERWKADGNSKRQAESNAESIQRNLTSALPGMISGVRAAPQDLGAEFKLYRNVNALYDVVSSLTESTGAFGPKSDYEALAQQLDTLDSVRRNLGDSLEQLSASTQSQLDQLRTQVKTLQATATAAPPKKVVVDDTQPAAKGSASHKKKVKKPDQTSSESTASPAPQ